MTAAHQLSLVSTADQPQVFTVAFASSDRQTVDQHFGNSTQFLVYGLFNNEWQLQQILRFEPEKAGHSDNKIDKRVELLKGTDKVICNAVGGSAVRKLMQAGITPITKPSGADIQPILVDMKKLAKAFNEAKSEQDSSERLASLLDEEW